MDWTTPPEDQPIWSPAGDQPVGSWASSPAGTTPQPSETPSPSIRPRLGGIRRTVATAFLAVGLLIVGGVAVVNAADPSGSAAPNATTQPSTGSGNGAAPGSGSPRQAPNGAAPNGQAPNGGAPSGRAGHDCPNMGSGSSGQRSGGSTAPSTPTTPSSSGTPSSSNL